MKSLFAINKYLIKYIWYLIGGTIFIALSNLFALYPAQITRKTIDYIAIGLKQKNVVGETVWQNETIKEFTSQFLMLLAMVIGATILKGIFMFFMRQTIIVMSRRIEFEQKNEIYKHYQQLPQSFYKHNSTGDLMSRISEDVGQVRMYTGPAIMYSLNLIILFFVTITAMVRVNSELTLYVLLPLPLLSISIYYVSDIINKKSMKLQTQLSSISTFVQETFSGIRVIKGFNRENVFHTNFSKSTREYYERSIDLVKTEAIFAPTITLLIGLSTLITIYIGGRQAIIGKITIGNIAEFVMYVNMLTWPVTSIGWVTSVIQKAAASQQRINEFLNVKNDIVNVTSKPFELKGNIEFRNVTFTYANTNITAIKNLSFKLDAGKSLGIIGNTGSGKSTIAALITRVYDATEGEVLIDGINIKEINLDDFRKQIGYVPQDVFLFSDTVANNIGFAADEIKMNDIIEVAKLTDVHENITNFSKGYETIVGERGITLSGGQKQRISIARALLKNPKMYIFDDCLSAVDTVTENHILNNLEKQSLGKTSVLISHRASTIKNAEHIIVLESGQLIEQGTHSELMNYKGSYASLFEKQQVVKSN